MREEEKKCKKKGQPKFCKIAVSQLGGSAVVPTTTTNDSKRRLDSYCNQPIATTITMAKTKNQQQQQQQEENDQGGGGSPKKKSRTGTANTNDNGNVWETWEAEEEYEIDLLESRKIAAGEIEGRVQWKDADGNKLGETEWVVSATICSGTDLLFAAVLE